MRPWGPHGMHMNFRISKGTQLISGEAEGLPRSSFRPMTLSTAQISFVHVSDGCLCNGTLSRASCRMVFRYT